MTCITETIELEEHCGNMQPKEPWKFKDKLQYSQDTKLINGYSHSVLFNKGRYFETSIYNKEVLREVSELTGIAPQYGNMIVGSWKKLEDFVIAMNCLGIYVKIDLDWV